MATPLEALLLSALGTGLAMREAQKRYFKHRRQDDLMESKRLEKAFDKAAQDLIDGQQDLLT